MTYSKVVRCVFAISSLSLAAAVESEVSEIPESRWAVIAAGSAGFMNYRHQADACHAYHVMRKSGIPPSNIILMMEDDAANSNENKLKGTLFNKLNGTTDVYKGCQVDYRGKQVTAELFLNVITGNTSGVPAGGKVLKSTASDRVFLNFVDHGGVGLVSFPHGPFLHAMALHKALTAMKQKKMYKELVFYMEACESGSMFPQLSPKDGIYAVTAANARESSWGYYCMPKDDVVNGIHLGTCLGDLFSIAWMEDSDMANLGAETLGEQFKKVKARTNKSHVMSFGDTSFLAEPIGNFEEGEVPGASASAGDNGAIGVRDISLHTAWHRWEAARSPKDKALAWQEYQRVKDARTADEALFEEVVQEACLLSGPSCVADIQARQEDLKDMECHYNLALAVHSHCPRRSDHDAGGWNGFNMKFSRTLANLCEEQQHLKKTEEELLEILERACKKSSQAALESNIQSLENSLWIGGVLDRHAGSVAAEFEEPQFVV
mmetsp:Transcript_89049/g.157742  ORF Transcript_89049/g.157742 Transcript_89049/m.157742 type:complete len:491 (+) Transcript_89049:91-1563(+)